MQQEASPDNELKINGINVIYYDKGAGDAVLFLHGWGSNFSLFKPFLELLSQKYRAIAFNLPGFGGSSEPGKPWEVNDYAEFTIEFLKVMGIKKTAIIGHSYGGRIILKLCGGYNKNDLPFEVTKLILIDAAGIKPKKTARQKLSAFLYKIGKKVLLFAPVKKIFPEALSDWQNKRGSADYKAASPVMRATLVKSVNEDLTDCLAKINVPTLLVWGDKDTATPISDAKLMEKMIPDAGLVTFEGAGHYSFLERKEQFRRVLASYFELLI
ncbi:MAG: alpha/beta hydrolase [Lachnospiraceae bacterium]|jgi:pimeloyl-ACP methyl ester carboxylesterase|nr:alpha/beta hydrolase [Lachnospiraceae bacterium]